jgi:hypothetical protein
MMKAGSDKGTGASDRIIAQGSSREWLKSRSKPAPLVAEVPRNTFANVMIVAPARRELINK